MADHLTYPERVTPKNIENLKQCVRNGANSYPGAKLVRKLGVSMLWYVLFLFFHMEVLYGLKSCKRNLLCQLPFI